MTPVWSPDHPRLMLLHRTAGTPGSFNGAGKSRFPAGSLGAGAPGGSPALHLITVSTGALVHPPQPCSIGREFLHLIQQLVDLLFHDRKLCLDLGFRVDRRPDRIVQRVVRNLAVWVIGAEFGHYLAHP